MRNLIYSFHVDLAEKENIMEQFLDENVYIIDLGEVNTAPEIIFQLSSILDKEEAKNRIFVTTDKEKGALKELAERTMVPILKSCSTFSMAISRD